MKIATDTKHIERLATAYAAYHVAVVAGDDDGVLCWGPIVLDAMAMTATFEDARPAIERLINATRHVVAMRAAA